MPLEITALPAFRDNYIWLLQSAGEVWVVDPGDAAPVLEWLQAHGKTLDGILLTHHHADHIGGLNQLVQPGIRVAGPGRDVLPQTSEPVEGGERLRVADLEFEVLAVPGHTLNHIAFFCPDAGGSPLLFCGDTLFVAGCGRLFEGTPAQMFESLGLLRNLPENTRVYCAHEYTLANLKFAARVEPDNQDISNLEQQARRLRDKQQPTVPSTLASEKRTNPFLRTHLANVRENIARHAGSEPESDVECFAYMREWKDQF